MTSIQFRVMGPVEVTHTGLQARIGSGRQRTALAVLLAARGEAVTVDRPIDVVWQGNPPASARESLQSHVKRLRAALADLAPDVAPAVVTAGDGYRLNLAARARRRAVRGRPGQGAHADR